jgi:hypothetical protein
MCSRWAGPCFGAEVSVGGNALCEIPRMVAHDWVNKKGQTYRICNGLLISPALTLGAAKRVNSITSESGKLGEVLTRFAMYGVG